MKKVIFAMLFVNSLLSADIIQSLISVSSPISYADALAQQSKINFMVRHDGCLNLSTAPDYIKHGKESYINSYMLNRYQVYRSNNQKIFIFSQGENNSIYTDDLQTCTGLRDLLMGK